MALFFSELMPTKPGNGEKLLSGRTVNDVDSGTDLNMYIPILTHFFHKNMNLLLV